ncbi:MAG: LysE family translocator [Desulfobulbaceae bacterium]|nr:LysE family translocator [Desulfobulbaceae bacterium]
MINYILSGTLLGLSAGFSPGPLLTLVVSETLQHGTRAGFKVALAPILTDLPIIVLTVFVLGKLSGFNTVMGGVSLLGGLVVMFLGYQGLRTRGDVINPEAPRSDSMLKGVIVNLLSPYPYLFWLGVGAPIMLKAAEQNLAAAAGFVVTFYVLLVGAKLVLALLVGRSRTFLTGRAYLLVMRGLGLLLVFFSCYLFRQGWLLYVG